MARPCQSLIYVGIVCLLTCTSARGQDDPPPLPDPGGPSTFGQHGLFHSWAASTYTPGSFVLNSSVEYFKASDFLVDGDENQRLASRISLAWTPFQGFEVVTGLSLAVNYNSGFTPDQTHSVGDPYLGARYGYAVTKWLTLGGGVQVLMPTGQKFSQLSTDGISTRILTAFDFKPIPEMLVTLNVGYHFDNTKKIFDYDLNPAQRFSAGVFPHDQLLLNLGIAYQLGPVAPFVEYGTAQALGADGLGFGDSPNWITIGLRAFPLSTHSLHLMAAVDIGVGGVKDIPAGEARIPPYNVILGVGFDFGLIPKAEPKVEIREVVVEKIKEVQLPPPPCPKPPSKSQIVGQVLDANTGNPIPGARIQVGDKNPIFFLSDPVEGRFTTCLSDPGPVKLQVTSEGYREETQAVLLTENPKTEVAIKLIPAKGQTFGVLKGTIRAATGQPLQALITIPTRNIKAKAEKKDGKFEFKLATGVFDVLIANPGYVTQRRKVKLGPGDVVILNVELFPKK